MRIAKVCLFALAIASFVSSQGFGAVADRVSGTVNSAQRMTLPGQVHRMAIAKFDQGAVDPSMRMGTMTLMTLPTAAQQKALTQLLAEQQDRKSANYHKWLTPEQFADRFGLSQHDIQQIVSWLKSQGFSSVQAARGRNWVSFNGAAAQVQSAFGTEIHHYRVAGKLHYANSKSPVIPAAMAGVVVGVQGLHDFRPRPHGIRRNAQARPYYDDTTNNYGQLIAPGDIATIYNITPLRNAGIDGTGQKIAVMGQTDIYLSDLTNFRTGFGMSAISCTTNGTGVITACNDPHFQYKLYGGDPGLSTNGDISEADLDIEWSGAVAPNAQIIYVNSTDTFTSFNDAIDNNLAPVISLSYGLCEFDDNTLSAHEVELQKANSQGITFINSSGDSGAAECDYYATVTNTNLATQGVAVSYPASSPEVTGVGGSAVPLVDISSATYWGSTTATDGGSALQYVPEQAWNDDAEIAEYCQDPAHQTFCTTGGGSQAGWVPITSQLTAQEDIGLSSTGGGASNCAVQNGNFSACVSGFPKPSWQSVTVSGQANVRYSPDISFFATPNFPGYIFCTQLSELNDTGTGSSCDPGGAAGITAGLGLNNPPIIGGTSASAPVFAGMVALLNQYLGSGGQGNINPTLYELAATPSNGIFHAITTGNNQVYCQANTPSNQPVSLQCPASGVLGFDASVADGTTGYNLVTGLGSIDLNNLAAALTSFAVSASALNPTSVAAGASVTTTITVASTNGFSGTVNFSCTGLPAGATCSFSPTTVTGSGTTTMTIATLPDMAAGTTSATVKAASGAESATTTVSLVVTATAEAFSLTSTVSGGTVTVAQGQTSGAIDLTVTSSSGFIVTAGSSQSTVVPVTYSCTGLPSEATCNFSPSNTSSATSITLTVKTTGPTAELRQPIDRGMHIFYAMLLPGLFGIVVMVGGRKRSVGAMRVLGLLLLLGVSTAWMASCGGSSNSSSKDPGTPKGTYTVTVNAATTGASPVTASPVMTFQLVVN